MSEALTMEDAGALLADLLPGHGQVRAVTRFAEGSITGAYRVDFADTASPPVVLKLYAADDHWSATQEARTLRFLAGHGIDVSPRLLAYADGSGAGSAADTDARGGRPCVVASLRPGRTLTTLDDELTPDQRREVYRQLGGVLARLHAVPADGYGRFRGSRGGDPLDYAIHDPAPDNAAHMERVFAYELGKFRRNGDQALADGIAAHVAAHASAFAECPRPAFCHGDVHEPNLLAELDEDGGCHLTGLLDPINMHVGDPLMDFVRLDAFSLDGDATKIAGLLAGYGVAATGSGPRTGAGAGGWPESWLPRMRLYRIALALELYNWFSECGQHRSLPGLDRDLRGLIA